MKFQLKPTSTALILSGIALAFSQAALADVTVKIGSAAPMTGGIAHIGQDQDDGVKLAVEEINKSGLTINGQKVTLQLVSQDDQADPKTGTAVAQKMVDDGVVAVIGHLNSGVSIPASKIYSEGGVAQLTPASTNPKYTLQGYKTTFRVIGTDAQQGPALARYAKEHLNAKSVAIVDDATAYGQGLADEFEKTAKAEGLKVVSRDATNDKATDFRAILTKIKAARPDIIMYGGMDATGGPFAKQASQLAIKSRIVAGDGVCTADLTKLAGDAVNGVVCSIAGLDPSKAPGGVAFAKKLKDRFHHDIVLYSPASYDATYVVVDAMKRANSVKKEDILAALPKTNYNGVIGNIQFDDHGDMKGASISIYKYVDGKQTLLDIVKM